MQFSQFQIFQTDSETISLANIPYLDYSIYVYFSGDQAGRAGTVNIGSTTYDFSTLGSSETSGLNALLVQTVDSTGANPGADYAQFANLSGSSQTISLNIPGYGGIAGIQVVQAVPEPGTIALGTLGGIFGLVALRRRR